MFSVRQRSRIARGIPTVKISEVNYKKSFFVDFQRNDLSLGNTFFDELLSRNVYESN